MWCGRVQDTLKAWREVSTDHPHPAGRLDPQQAKALGWYPHDKPFLYPAPRDPATYNTHPLKPSDFRYQHRPDIAGEGEVTAAGPETAPAGGTHDCMRGRTHVATTIVPLLAGLKCKLQSRYKAIGACVHPWAQG